MVTNNSCNFALGSVNQVLTMTGTTTMTFRGRTQNSSSRTLNTVFQPSSTQDSTVSYSVDITCVSTLLGGQSGTVILEMATNSGFTTGVQTLSQFTNSNAVALAIAITVTQLNTACLNGYIPAGNFVRLRTVSNTGTPSFTYQVGQEVLL